MKISSIFKLGKTQAELDFIDIDIAQDTPLFLDPFFLNLRSDNWSLECTRLIKSFFQRVISYIRDGNIIEAKRLFEYLHEPNATCLGLSRGKPRGRGIGKENTNDIFESIISSRAVQTGLVQDLEDTVLFVDGFGKDKLSDMTTNIIRRQLIHYTNAQCTLHQIPQISNVPSGFFWNRESFQWEQLLTTMLVVEERVILLVPKGVASYSDDYTSEKYYRHFVLHFMQHEHLKINSGLVKERKDGTRYVTKSSLEEQFPFSKNFITDFTQQHPEVLTNFKRKSKSNSLTNQELADIDLRGLVTFLISTLQNTNPGNEHATRYHRLITGILEIIFYPLLISPTLEEEIHNGRKRIDIVFDNAASIGIFYRLHAVMQLPCQYIFIECKNYSDDPTNPEIDQLAGRFSPNRGRVGFLVCRTIQNYDLFLNRCRDTYRDNRGLIIPLVDEEIITLLRNYNNWNDDFIEKFLSNKIREIALN